MINVNKPNLPKLEDFKDYLDGIWSRNWVTNHGPLVNEFELKLKEFLNVEHLLFVTNGTIALQLAIKVLNLKGEILTTPFSYVATLNSIIWENCTPVFVDIDVNTFNVDSLHIENKISDRTSGMLFTHVFGNPVDIEKIEKIAKKNNLKLIFDAAHAVRVNYKNKSVFEFGDISTLSLHATKVLHTVEGGALVTKSSEILKRVAQLRNFGHQGAENFVDFGINGKNCEFHAAMGLCNLKEIGGILEKRKNDYLYYYENLKGLPVDFQKINEYSEYNYSYFPIVFKSTNQLEKTINLLNEYKIYPRRYFYPSLNKVKYLEGKKEECKNSEYLAERIICLPLYYTLGIEEVDMICRLIKRSFRY